MGKKPGKYEKSTSHKFNLLFLCGLITIVVTIVAVSFLLYQRIVNHGNTVSKVTTEQIEAAQKKYDSIITEADRLTEKYCNSNNEVSIDDLPTLLQEVAQYANELKNTGVISSFSYSNGDTCVYMQIDDWLNILYDPIVDDYMAGGLDRDFQIITLEPNASSIEMYFNYVTTGAEGADHAAQLIENSFDNFYFSTNLDNKKVTIDSFVNLPQNSIIIFSGHGGYASEVGGVLFTGVDAWDKDLISKYCETGSKAVCFNKKGQAYLTSEFFDRYVKDEQYYGDLFYLGSCSSCQDARLFQSIWDKGARAIVGNSNSVYIRYNFKMIASFFEGLSTQNSNGNYRTISEALEYAQNIHGKTDGNLCQVIACYRDDFRLSEMGLIPVIDYFVDTSFSVAVLDEETNPYGDYTLFISGNPVQNGPVLQENNFEYQHNEVITSTTPVALELDPGVYTLTVSDNADPQKTNSVTISVYDDDKLGHNVEIKTGFGKNSRSTELDVLSTFGFTKAWDMHDNSGFEHIVTSFALRQDGLFYCGVGVYLGDWLAGIIGNYHVEGDTIYFNYTYDGMTKESSYQVNWDDMTMKQTSEENIVIPHQIGSVAPLEENPWFTADELMKQVDLARSFTGYDDGDNHSGDNRPSAVKYEDELTGDYMVDDTGIRISISATNNSDYTLTYSTPSLTLENIPVMYFEENTSSRKELVFAAGPIYPDHPGAIHVIWTTESLFPYAISADVDGVEGTNSDYYSMTKLGVFTPIG